MAVHEPTSAFDFSKLALVNPYPVQGGSYFTKITMDNKPLNLQLPNCYTKQGIIRTKKSKYCDIMYDSSDSAELTEWVESLELRCQKLIDDKKNMWFHNEITSDDITSMMSPVCRLYRCGKKILLRTHLEQHKLSGADICIAYNENREKMELTEIDNTHNIIPLLCVDGIKFTSRSFEISLSLRQIMVIDNSVKEDSVCMIKWDKSNTLENNILSEKIMKTEDLKTEDLKTEDLKTEDLKTEDLKTEIESTNIQNLNADDIAQPPKSLADTSVNTTEATDTTTDTSVENKPASTDKNTETNTTTDTDAEPNKAQNDDVQNTISDCLEEVNIELSDEMDTLQLRKPNEVYYEIYRAAKSKAKHMRKVALDAYMEAKNIKDRYMLESEDDASDNDNASDNENASDNDNASNK